MIMSLNNAINSKKYFLRLYYYKCTLSLLYVNSSFEHSHILVTFK